MQGLQGTIKVESKAGKGARFVLEFPRPPGTVVEKQVSFWPAVDRRQ
jgi:signal transduction histidine kinase